MYKKLIGDPGPYLLELQKIVFKYLNKLNENTKYCIFYYFINYLIVCKKLKTKNIKTYLKAYIQDILKFYNDKYTYLSEKAREFYKEDYNLSVGEYMYTITEDSFVYRIFFHHSLFSNVKLYHNRCLEIPKLSKKEIEFLKKSFL